MTEMRREGRGREDETRGRERKRAGVRPLKGPLHLRGSTDPRLARALPECILPGDRAGQLMPGPLTGDTR